MTTTNSTKLFGAIAVEEGVVRWLRELPRWAFLVVMAAGSALMTWASLGYFDFETLPPFVIEKLPVRFESLWLGSLRVHVASALLTFPLCLLLMTRWSQRRPLLHRWLGRFTGISVLLALVPSGVVLAFDAKGGAGVTAGFLVSAALLTVALVFGIGAARRRDFNAHRRALRHVVAQMSVAVTSRAMILGMDAAGVTPEVAYAVALWVPVSFSALVAELVSLPAHWFRHFAHDSIERIRRENVTPAVLVRARALVRPVVRPRR